MPSTMPNTGFWEIFTAISTAIGSLATAGAVIFALWGVFRTKERLSITMSSSMVVSDNPSVDYIGVNVLNVGDLPTKVRYIGFTSYWQRKKKTLCIFTPHNGTYNEKIEIHDSQFFLLVPREQFMKDITKDRLFGSRDKIYVCVITPVKEHRFKTRYRFGDFYSVKK